MERVPKRTGPGMARMFAATWLAMTVTAAHCQAPAPRPASDRTDFPILISDSNTGYIDNAIVGSQVRVRFDASFDQERPDRAEFFYAKCGCYRPADPSAPGMGNPGSPERSVDAAELSLGLEYAPLVNLSLFAELPYRAVNPEVNPNASGLGDIQLGVKYALLATRENYLTLQVRAYAPSGDARKGLGTHHWSIEPGLLYYGRLSERAALAGEMRLFVPIDGSSGQATGFNRDFAGDVIRYGIGLSYDFDPAWGMKFSPVVELVGWSILGGIMTDATTGPESARANILNLKVGARVAFNNRDSVYLGYGYSLTKQDWYQDIVRLEYRHTF